MPEFFHDAKKISDTDRVDITIDELATAYTDLTHEELVATLPRLRSGELNSISFALPTAEHDLVDIVSSSDRSTFLHALNTAIIATTRRRYELIGKPDTQEDNNTIFRRWIATVVECPDSSDSTMMETTETHVRDGKMELPVEVSFRLAMPPGLFDLLVAECERTEEEQLTPA